MNLKNYDCSLTHIATVRRDVEMMGSILGTIRRIKEEVNICMY